MAALPRMILIPLGLAGALLIGASMVQAQLGGPPAFKLHEDMVVPPSESDSQGGGDVVGPGVGHQNPTAFKSQGKLIAQPDLDKEASPGEGVLGEGFGVDRQTEMNPDYNTSADGQLQYTEVFNPAIVPFKRMSALDGIREDFHLYAASSAQTTDLPVGDADDTGYDRFWGDLLVDLKPGRNVPIPSVSPEMLIASYQSSPKTSLIFSKDPADNFYVRSEEAGVSGTYRINFQALVRPEYIAPPPVIQRIRIRDIPRGIVHEVPASVAAAVGPQLDRMRLHKGMFADDALQTLVSYFSAFDAKSPPPNTGNVYNDLVQTQAGVCRHRSFGFMVTANVLGLPTRYVSNTAHAWVEVWLPGSRWMRIDLGGAAVTLNVDNAGDKAMYRPRNADRYDRPENYENNYSNLEGDVTGLRDDQIDERQSDPYQGGDSDGGGNGTFFDDGSDESERKGQLTGPGSDLPVVPQAQLDGKEMVYLEVSSASTKGYRGEQMQVAGSIIDQEGLGIPNMRINIFLAPPNNGGNDSERIGIALSDDNGNFAAVLDLPVTLETAPYVVLASSDGTTLYQPGLTAER